MTVTARLSADGRRPSSPESKKILDEVSGAVVNAKRCIVLTGAGVSVSSGIPDFRSSDGLYKLVQDMYPGHVMKGKDLFDVSLFRDANTTSLFYAFMFGLKDECDRAQPTRTHKFIQLLDRKGKLVRNYTQNIDGLEARLGMVSSSSSSSSSSFSAASSSCTDDSSSSGRSSASPPRSADIDLSGLCLSSQTSVASSGAVSTVKLMSEMTAAEKKRTVKVVQLHGDIHRMSCMTCSAEFEWGVEEKALAARGEAPQCPACVDMADARVKLNKRSINVGVLRPSVVLYGEPHPCGDDIGDLQWADLGRRPDLLIVMGTSLKVTGFKAMVKDFARAVHSSSLAGSKANAKGDGKGKGKVIFVNRTPVAGSEWDDVFDYHVQTDTDSWTAMVEEDWRRLKPEVFAIQTTLDDHFSGVTKATVAGLKKKNKAGQPMGEERRFGKADAAGSSPHSQVKHAEKSMPKQRAFNRCKSAPSNAFGHQDENVLVGARAPPLSPSKRQRRSSTSSARPLVGNSPSKLSNDGFGAATATREVEGDDMESDSDLENLVRDSPRKLFGAGSPLAKTKWKGRAEEGSSESDAMDLGTPMAPKHKGQRSRRNVAITPSRSSSSVMRDSVSASPMNTDTPLRTPQRWSGSAFMDLTPSPRRWQTRPLGKDDMVISPERRFVPGAGKEKKDAEGGARSRMTAYPASQTSRGQVARRSTRLTVEAASAPRLASDLTLSASGARGKSRADDDATPPSRTLRRSERASAAGPIKYTR